MRRRPLAFLVAACASCAPAAASPPPASPPPELPVEPPVIAKAPPSRPHAPRCGRRLDVAIAPLDDETRMADPSLDGVARQALATRLDPSDRVAASSDGLRSGYKLKVVLVRSSNDAGAWRLEGRIEIARYPGGALVAFIDNAASVDAPQGSVADDVRRDLVGALVESLADRALATVLDAPPCEAPAVADAP